MNNRFGKFSFLIFVSFLAFTFSCNPEKHLNRNYNNKNSLQTKVQKSAVQYKNFSIRGKAKFDTPEKKLKFSFKLNAVKDSAMWCSFQMFGIEGARALITQDSIKMIDRLTKTYGIESFESISKKLGAKLSFSQLQDLLLGNIYFGEKSFAQDTNAGEKVLIDSVAQRRIVYFFHKKNYRPSKIRAKAPEKEESFEVDFNEYEAFGKNLVPMEISFKSKKRQKGTYVKITYNKIKIDEGLLTFKFRIPEAYKKLE